MHFEEPHKHEMGCYTQTENNKWDLTCGKEDIFQQYEAKITYQKIKLNDLSALLREAEEWLTSYPTEAVLMRSETDKQIRDLIARIKKEIGE